MTQIISELPIACFLFITVLPIKRTFKAKLYIGSAFSLVDYVSLTCLNASVSQRNKHQICKVF